MYNTDTVEVALDEKPVEGFFLVLKKSFFTIPSTFLVLDKFTFSLTQSFSNNQFDIYYTLSVPEKIEEFIRLVKNQIFKQERKNLDVLVILFTKQDVKFFGFEKMCSVIKEVFEENVVLDEIFSRDKFVYYFCEVKDLLENYIRKLVKIRNSIKNEEIFFACEPIIDAKGNLYGLELLARIIDNNGYVLRSSDFFVYIEKDKKLFETFEHVVFSKMLSIASNKDKFFPKIKKLHFNFTPEFIVKNVKLFEKHLLKEPYVNSIEIELTEKSFFSDACLDVINYLTRKGISFVIDDFGKGTSNLDVLIKTEVEGVKIEVDFYKSGFNYLDAFLKALHKAGRKIFFEKVEDKDTFTRLKTDDTFSKCYYQGFLFARSVLRLDIERYINNQLGNPNNKNIGTETDNLQNSLNFNKEV